MLDVKHPWGGRVRPFRSVQIQFRIADEGWQTLGYYRLREQTFVHEQRLFSGSDRDTFDERALPIVALSQSGGMPDAVVGVVRVYRVTEHVWVGGRLAVCPSYRRHGVVGQGLIKAAVGAAIARGCSEFRATVQKPNVRYFERHHFEVVGEEWVAGRAHALMAAKLERFQGRLRNDARVAA